jgi:hypothetical protein
MNKILIFLVAKFIALGAFCQTYSVIENKIYDADLKTVQLYAFGNGQNNPGVNTNVLSLASRDQMVLEFDDLKASYRQFHVKIHHCNLDWTASRLRDLEYLSDYNDFIINDYEVSQNTKIAYYHYGYVLPEIKLAGNYVLYLYENSISNRPVATLRFHVLNSQIGITANIQTAQDPAFWRTHEQVNFELSYGNYDVRDPRNDFEILIRQNFRDETIKKDFRASSLNGSRRTLSYRFFNNENLFKAGNEFRYADLRSNFNRGTNVAEIQLGYEDNVWLVPQTSRSVKTYLESADLNGRYVIETIGGGNSSINADYMHVHAGFKTLEIATNQKLCMLGKFNDYDCSEVGQLNFNADFGGYETTISIKQGVYDFQFGVIDQNGLTDFTFLEGDFSDTKNSYEIFVYHKPPAAKSELLIGYALIQE